MNQWLQPSSSGWHSRGYLPHFDGAVVPQSITFRLFDSLPKILLERWSYELSHNRPESREAELRQRIEAYLDRGIGSASLRNVRVATIVENALLFFDDQRYTLSA